VNHTGFGVFAMPRPRAGIVYVGLKSTVIALDRRTGEEVWRTPLKGGVGKSTSFVALQRDGDLLYAGVGGEIWALDPKTGAVTWHNPLKGFGYGIPMILDDGENARSSALPPALGDMKRQSDAAAAAAASA
jgi:outer membrane protein assembly factor BamB